MAGFPPPPSYDPDGTLAPGSPDALPSVEVTPAGSTPSAPVRASLPRPGERVAGYQVERLLGRGGMGAVFLARDSLGRQVALKVQLGGRFERFNLEGQAIARLLHEGIVPIHAQGCDEQGRLYCVMGLVPGGSLDAYLAERAPLPPREAVDLVLQAAEAMAYAHENQVLHRDLKPANLLRTPAGRVVITDFGLARVVDQSQHLSQTGDLLGTPAYMSPEQARGEVHRIGPGADIYSLGATLYDLLCERPPFADMPAIQLLLSVANLPPDPPSVHRPEVDPGLDALVMRCLAKDPAERYASMEDLAADLRAYLEDGASGVSALANARARTRRRVLGAGALGLLAAALPFALLSGSHPTPPPPSLASTPERSAAAARLRLKLGDSLSLEPGQRAHFEVGAEVGGVRLDLRGPPGALVRIEGGAAKRRLLCEPGWDLPVLLDRTAKLRPLLSGSYRVELDPSAAGPVEVRSSQWPVNERFTSPARRDVWCIPSVEESFRGDDVRARARTVLATFRENFRQIRLQRARVLGSRLFHELRDLARDDGLPPSRLLLAALGIHVLKDGEGHGELAPQRVALELLPNYPRIFAVRWYAAEATGFDRPLVVAEHLSRCRELEPDRPGPREWLLAAWADAGQLSQLEREARQMLAFCPHNWRAQLAFRLATQPPADAAEAARCCALLPTLSSSRLRSALIMFEASLQALAAAGRREAAEALARAFLDGQEELLASKHSRGNGVRPWNRLVKCRAILLCEGSAAARELWSLRPRAADQIAGRWRALRDDIDAGG